MATRVGLVSITKLGKQKYRLRWTENGREVQRRISGTMAAVRESAEYITRQLMAGRGYLEPSARVPTVVAVIAASIRLSRQNELSKRGSAYWGDRFVAWINSVHPEIETFDQVRPAMVQEYVRQLEEQGKAADTVRLALAPIRAAWRYAVGNYPEDVHPLPAIRLAESREPMTDCLDAGEVRTLLNWLRSNARHLWGIATLQAWAGLRILEAAYLRRSDVDWQRGTIQITDHPQHALKTSSSRRTLPVCAEVLDCLAELANEQVVIPPGGELFVSLTGALWTKSSVGSSWRRYVQGCRPGRQQCPPLGERIAGVPQRRLRASFATAVSQSGVSDVLIRAYLGHTPTDILGRHYRQIGVEELRAVAEGVRKTAGQNPDTEGIENGASA